MIALVFLVVRNLATLIQRGPRMADIVLHLGAHRTATTTFQGWLDQNETEHGGQGIALWTPRRTRTGLFSGLVRPAHSMGGDATRRGERATGIMQIETRRLEMTGMKQLVVSEENILGAVRANLRKQALYPDARVRLDRFGPALRANCRRIILTIRAYDMYWASALAFGVAKGHRLPDAEMCDRLITQPRRWRDVIRDIKRAFPRSEIVVATHEHWASHPERLLAHLTGRDDLPSHLTGCHGWQNRSLTCDALRDIVVARTGDVGAIPAGHTAWMPFDAAQRAALQAQYRIDLTWLKQGASGLARFLPTPTAVAQPLPIKQHLTATSGPAGRIIAMPRSARERGNDGTEKHVV